MTLPAATVTTPPEEPLGPVVVGVVPAPAELTVTLAVFVMESAFEGVIVSVNVLVPVEAAEDAKIVHDTPALCPPDMVEGEQPEDMLKSLGEAVMVPNCAEVSPEFWMFRLKEKVEP